MILGIVRSAGIMFILLAIAASNVNAETEAAVTEAPEWTAESSDPSSLDWMTGAPPPEDKTIRFTDGSYFTFPQMRWSVCNFQQLMPSKPVNRGLGAPRPLSYALDEHIDNISFTTLGDSREMSWEESLAANFTDGIIVLHKGDIVYERYFGCLEPAGKHAAMSVTKSFTGLLAEILVAEGALDDQALVSEIVPELAGSAFGMATVRQVMDMTTGLDYSEDYSDPDAEVWLHAAAGSPLPKPEGYTGPRTYFEFLQTVEPLGEHGDAFGYKTVNSDALGWIISRVSGKDVATLLAEKIWSQIGAQQDAYITVDSIGTPFAGGGLNLGLRDLALLGQLMLNEGQLDGKQIIPAKAVASISQGGSPEAFAKAGYKMLEDWSYRSMWWVTHNDHGAYMARGVHGQALYIDPTADVVIARFASYPVAGNAAIDPTSLPAYEAMAEYLLGKANTETADSGPGHLVQERWVLSEIRYNDHTTLATPLNDDGSLSEENWVEFTADGVFGRAGINRFSGEYSAVADGSLEFGNLAMTKALNPPDSIASSFEMLIGQTYCFRIEDGMLYLDTSLDSGTLVFAPGENN